MKLFAKRTKKVAPPSSKERTVFKSDPVCEELLKQDPSTWNAKQRRMIKRYQERKQEAGNEGSSDSGKDNDNHDQEENREGDKRETQTEEAANEDASASSSDSSDNSESSNDEDEGEDDDQEISPHDSKKKQDDESNSIAEDQKNEHVEQSSETSPDGDGFKPQKLNSEGGLDKNLLDLNEILDRLDSKNRRKLRRKLDRGEATESDIRKEAMYILEPSKQADVSKDASRSEKRSAEGSAPEEKKGKKRKLDWNTLPPEERMRREEQRRRQQEVAALREAGELPQGNHRHPLNSERRRANRRKPKWERKAAGNDGGTNQHNASGFQMRKSQAIA